MISTPVLRHRRSVSTDLLMLAISLATCWLVRNRYAKVIAVFSLIALTSAIPAGFASEFR